MLKRHPFVVVLILASCGVVAAAAAKLVRNYRIQQALPDYRVLDRTVSEDRFELTILSAPYELDQVFKSMQGPSGIHPRLRLIEGGTDDETLYVTGVETQVVDSKTFEPISNEFYCHANMTLCPATTTPEKHNGAFPNVTHMDWRLFTLVPGRWSIQLPEGFGIPIKNKTEVDFLSMSLNQNPGLPERTIRMRTKIIGRRGTGLRPLFRRSVYVYQQHVLNKSQASNSPGPGAKKHQGELCAGRKLQELGVQLDAVVTSPLVRAVQTAELLTAQLGYDGEIEALLELIPEGRPTIAADELPTRGGAVAALSHEPTISAIASLMTNVHYRGFKPGEVACVDEGRLLWSLDPDSLKVTEF